MSSKTIVFVHGAFVSKRCWEAWVRRYEAQGYTCIPTAWPGRDKPVAELKATSNDPVLSALTLQDVADHLDRTIRALPEKPVIMGHSFGGLLTQLMLQRGLGAAGVAIDSVPPQGVLTLKWSFVRSLWPVITPFASISQPYYMPFTHFQYTFGNDLSLEEQRAAYDAEIVPESRRLARGGLSSAARVDFKRRRPPLLLIAGEKDHIMPASLNRSNYRRYLKSPSVTDFKEFPGRAHYSVIGGPGWEEVADYALSWAEEAQEMQAKPATAPSATAQHAGDGLREPATVRKGGARR